MFVRADVEFEDGLNMDFLLHKPLYFKEPEWFHDLTNEKLIKSYVAILIGIYWIYLIIKRVIQL